MKIILILATLIAAIHSTSALAATAAVVTERTLLLVDDHDVLYRSGTKRHFHPAKRNPSNPVIREDQPWESAIAWSSVYRDPKTGKYQLWYQAGGAGVGYAESDDGIEFHKPKLAIHAHREHAETNLVLIGAKGYGQRYCNAVIVEPDDPDPSRRYKMLYYDFSKDKNGEEWPGYHAAFSPDGIRWTKSPAGPLNHQYYGGRGAQPLFAGERIQLETPVPAKGDRKATVRKQWRQPFAMSDAVDVFREPTTNLYVVYGKAWLHSPTGGMAWKHGMARVDSPDFLHWSKPRMVCSPDDLDPPNLEFHTAPVFYHKGMYFCLNQLLLTRAEIVGATADLMEIELMISRDGLKWERPFRNMPFLGPPSLEEFTTGSCFTNSTPVILNDEIRFYYGGYRSGLNKDAVQMVNGRAQKGGIGFATLPLDRFAGVRPVESSAQITLPKPVENIGQVTFKPIDFTGVRRITVNADGREGSVWIELLNEDGFRVPAFSKEDAAPIRTDALRHAIEWKEGKLGDLPIGKYLIRAHLDKAELFAITLHYD